MSQMALPYLNKKIDVVPRALAWLVKFFVKVRRQNVPKHRARATFRTLKKNLTVAIKWPSVP